MQNIFLSSLLIIKDCSLSKAGSLFWVFCAAHLSGSTRPAPCFAPFAVRSAAGFLPGLHGMQEACGAGQQSGQQPAQSGCFVDGTGRVVLARCIYWFGAKQVGAASTR